MLKGSETEKNLLKAFAGESQARNRYTYFASEAKKAGFEQSSKGNPVENNKASSIGVENKKQVQQVENKKQVQQVENNHEVLDMRLAEQGRKNVEWAEAQMQSLMKVKERFETDGTLENDHAISGINTAINNQATKYNTRRRRHGNYFLITSGRSRCTLSHGL